MSYQTEREQFIASVTRENLPFWVARILLREATGLNRRAELACSSEAADRDRVPCPADPRHNHKPGPCLCDSPKEHSDITRITLQDHRAEQRIAKALPPGWTFQTAGDPRGCVLRIIPPSYAERNKDRDQWNLESIGVPNGPSGLKW